MTTHRAIIYTVGQTHTLYIDLTPEEAQRRWDEKRENMTNGELMLERHRGNKVERREFEFTNEIEIWGNPGEDLQDIAQLFLSGLTTFQSPPR